MTLNRPGINEYWRTGAESPLHIPSIVSLVSRFFLFILHTSFEACRWRYRQVAKCCQSMIRIRKGTVADIDGIMACYESARKYMRASGNLTQWVNGYPSRNLVAEDIAAGVSYVGEDPDGFVVMAFAFIIGNDPTYDVILDGCWPNTLPYATIHRLGSNGRYHGMLRLCVEFCMTMTDNLRLDTHADNATMRHAAEKLGFKRCGIIFCNDGTPRIAYQLCAPTNGV